MRSLYYRKQRASIHHPATIGDIPQEVLRKAFIYLVPGESVLVAPSKACRAWRPVAQGLMHSRQKFGHDGCKDADRFLCGLHLHSLVFGMGNVSINRLDIVVGIFGKDKSLLLAQLLSPTLSVLSLDCGPGNVDSSINSTDCYPILEVFFLHCRCIRSLMLNRADFGDDLNAISPNIKEGFGRLKKLDLRDCQGDDRMFVEATLIRDLRMLRFESFRDDDSDIVMAMAENYRALISIDLSVKFDSSAAILEVVECCRDLESLTLSLGGVRLESPDVEVLASLTRLKFLNFKSCRMTDAAVSALSQLRQLKTLGMRWRFGMRDGLNDVLRVIGGNLTGLIVWDTTGELCLDLAESCPNLEYFQIFVEYLDSAVIKSLNDGLKKKMKRLSSLKVNSKSLRLGTDWHGY
jgi:hypothetical protein